MKKMNPHRGSSFSDFLKGELKDPDFRREFEKVTAELLIGPEVRRIAKEKRLSVRELARRMKTRENSPTGPAQKTRRKPTTAFRCETRGRRCSRQKRAG